MNAPLPEDALTLSAAAGPEDAGRRLDVVLHRLAGEGVSRARIQEWIKAGKARVNGRTAAKPGLRLEEGDQLSLEMEPQPAAVAPEPGALDVVREDPAFLVLNKPAGLTVHPAPGEKMGTLVARVLAAYPRLAALEGERPGVVHRLDKDTSGLLAIALTEASRLALAGAFAEREVAKEYLAVVHGVPRFPSGICDAAIGRDPRNPVRMAVADKGGRPARSSWRTLWADPAGRAALLAVRIFTGRTHQIRVHLAHLGHPIVGDRTYGPLAQAAWRREPPVPHRLFRRQMLHAWRLAFDHPGTRERLAFQAPPPRDFLALLLALSRRAQRVAVTGLAGCGKSSLLADWAAAGVPTFSADAAVAALYEAGAPGWELLRRRFGAEIAPDGRPVDRRGLLARMRDSDAVRREVEHLIHPLVRHALEAFWAAHPRARLAAAEAPLFLEAGWEAGLEAGRGADVLLGVACPAAARRERLAARGVDQDLAALLDSWQWPEEKKLAACDLVADNAGSRADLARAAAAARDELLALRRRAARELAGRLRALFGAAWDDDAGGP
ncbi:MAG: dephospho-CoA kinase [Thermodesulfobacteriota bacterium]